MNDTSLFCCPLCQAALTRTAQGYLCPTGHCFDIAAAGYTHLLPANRKHSKNPGDDKQMVAARSAFLDAGYYTPLCQTISELVAEDCSRRNHSCILDCGCGEGYYTSAVAHTLQAAALPHHIAGIDISKFALKRAAKRLPSGEFAVASAYHLPLADSKIDLLLNVFSPLCIEEFSRILKPTGRFYYVVPSARHLWEMKEILYEIPYENQVKQEIYPNFQWVDCKQVRFTAHLQNNDHIMALFGMTPYAWKTPRAGIARLSAQNTLDTQIGFDIHIYERTP